MTALAESARVISGSVNLSEVLSRILEQISQAVDAEVVSLAMLKDQENHLEFIASTTNIEQAVVGKQVEIGQGIAGWVAQEKKGVIIPNPSVDDRFFVEFDRETRFISQAIACAPITSKGRVIGVLEAINPHSGTFDRDTLKVLTGIGSLAGTAIQNAQLFEALQSAHKRYRQLFEGSINSIIISDWNGQIQEANQQTAQLSQFTKAELQFSDIGMIHQINIDVLGSNFRNVREDSIISYESTLVPKNGEEIPVTVLVQAVNFETKPFIQWVFRDDTDRKELDQLREDLLSMVYHDLRSPLANVVSSLDVLNTMVDFKENSPAIQSLFDIAIRSTKRIQRLIDSLLDINRLESGHTALDLESASLKTLVQETLKTLQLVIESKQLKISTHFSDVLPEIMMDVDMIRRVIINLVENAIKYSPTKGSISIKAEQGKDFVQVSVQDTGPGIPKGKKEEIFQKYTRLHGKVGSQGYGLGLAYCKLAIEGHGGDIWVSDSPEGGSIFTFTIPHAI
jgi:PAS domain S-box-containing protein